MPQQIVWKKHLNSKEISSRVCGPSARLFANSELRRLSDPYVPFRTGALAGTVEITSKYLRYIVPYAHKMYEGEGFDFRTDTHPLATARWDQVAMKNGGKQKLAKSYTAYINKKGQSL